MKKFDQVINQKPALSTLVIQTLRYRLIEEELEEFREALIREDIIEVADALGDLLYVVYGAGCAFGIDLEPVFDEIHRANMEKEGGVHRKDGKWLKPAGWKPPAIEEIIAAQSK